MMRLFAKSSDLSRRQFIGYAAASASQLMLNRPSVCRADEPSPEVLEEQARKKAVAFLDVILKHPPQKLQSMHFLYDVYLKVSWNIQMKISATIRFHRTDGGFVSSFNLTEPEGVDGWSRLMMALVGRHTREYKELIEGIETRLEERFHFDSGRFHTDRLEEIMPENTYYANQTAIKLNFEYTQKAIQLWEDKQRASLSRSLPFTGQVGPLTAFFNYLFFNESETEISIINVLKQVEDDDTVPTPSDKKVVRYLFESQKMRFGRNTSGVLPAYGMMVSLAGGNFLDIVYGDYLYYQLAASAGNHVKIPYAAHAEGIISKDKKRKKVKQLKKASPHRDSFEKELLAEVDDILVARNIKVYLADFEAS